MLLGGSIQGSLYGKGTSGNKRYKKCMQLLAGKSEGKSPLGRPRYSGMTNIKKDLIERGNEDIIRTQWLGIEPSFRFL
jgi:hypothetical protein